MSAHRAFRLIPAATTIAQIAFEELESKPVRFGAFYWRSLCNGRRFPSRQDIKPRDIVGILSNMSLLKVVDGDFQYRIVGDTVVRAYDGMLHNRFIRDLELDLPSYSLFVRPILTHIMKEKVPVAVRGKIGHDAIGTNFTDHENALLPLGPDDDTVDHILVFSYYARTGI
jgi:hypothetical protein